MADDPRIADLVGRYQDEVEAGHTPDLAAWCRDCPDLLPELIKRTDRLRKLRRLIDGDSAPHRPGPDATMVFPTTPPLPADLPAPPGYEVLVRLGVGGMGVVYKAVQKSLGRVVALKMLHGDRAARELDLARFLGEAQALAAVPHPNIVQVFDNGTHEGHPYFSMEYCPGGTLAARLDHRPQDPRTAAGMMRTIALAAHHAHLKGIVHRDLKPGNVLVATEPPTGDTTLVNPSTRDPHADLKLTDFGLAKRVDDHSDRTLAGDVLGTPSYMSPEQARGQKAEAASDIWSLGAMLYEFLTGLPPFVSPSAVETLELVRRARPAAIRPNHPKVPADLETICLKCLRGDPKDRYVSAEALADDLTAFLNGMPINARPIGFVRRVVRWCRREPSQAGLVASLLAGLVAVSAILTWAGSQSISSREREAASKRHADAQRYAALMGQVRQLRMEARAGWTWQAKALLDEAALLPAARDDAVSLRSERAAADAAVDARPIREHAPQFPAAVVAVDGGPGFSLAPESIIPLIRHDVLRIGSETSRLSFTARVPTDGRKPRSHALAHSPDGRWLCLGLRGGTVHRWDLKSDTRHAKEWLAHPRAAVHGIAFDPRSKHLYTAGYDGVVRRWALDDGDKPQAESAPAGRLRGLSYWPGSRPRVITRAASGENDDRINGLAPWPGSREGMIAFGTEGLRLLDPQTLKDIPFDEGHALPAIPGSNGKCIVDPENRTIAVTRGGELEWHYWDRGIASLILRFVDPDLPSLRAAHSDTIEDLAIDPSGRLLATACPGEGRVKVWDTATGLLAVSIPFVDAKAVAFNRNGTCLIACGNHRTVEYELNNRGMILRQPFPIGHFSVTPEGHYAVVCGQPHPDQPGRGKTLAALFDAERKAATWSLHRADGPWGNRPPTVAHHPHGPIFHPGDDTSIALDGTAAPTGEIRAVTVCPRGTCWQIVGPETLCRRPAVGLPEKLSVGKSLSGRRDLCCLAANETHVIVGCASGCIAVVAGGRQEGLLPCFDPEPGAGLIEQANTVHAVALHPDGRRAVAGTEDGRIWLWDVREGKPIARWSGHADRVTTLAIDRGGDWLATGGRDRRVRLWRRAGGGFELHVTLACPGAGPVRQVAFSPDGATLLSSHDGESALRTWALAHVTRDP